MNIHSDKFKTKILNDELKAVLLNKKEVEEIHLFLQNFEKIKKKYKPPPKVIKPTLFKKIPTKNNNKFIDNELLIKSRKIKQTGGTILNQSISVSINGLIAAKQPNQTAIIVLSAFTPSEHDQPLVKIVLENGKTIKVDFFCFTTANAVFRRNYIFRNLFNGMPAPFDAFYDSNASKLLPTVNIQVPDEIIGGIHFYNDTPDPNVSEHVQLPLRYLLFDEHAIIPNQINVAILTDTTLSISHELIPTAIDIEKNQCISEHWDQVINPWHYLNQNIANYSQHPRIIQFATAIGDQRLSQRNCRSVPGNPPLTANIPNLIAEVQQKELEYDNLLLNKCNLTNINGEVKWGANMYTILYRGMNQPYNIEPDGNYRLLNYLHASFNINIAIRFAGNTVNRIIYRIHLLPGIPYFSYDNNPFKSYYGVGEQEIVFMRGLIAIPVDLPHIEAAVHPAIPIQNIQIIPPPNLLERLQTIHSNNTTRLITTETSVFVDDTSINAAILNVFGSPVAEYRGGSRKQTKKSYKNRITR